jgi:S-(hydroxymethyl)glutathione dehydrogenase / alcohol dehydrogenase
MVKELIEADKFKAAILVENNQPLVIAKIEPPESLDYGQVWVKLHYSGICGAQINEIEAAKGADPYLPHLLGHEGSGMVLEVGPGVTTVAAGDQVVLHWRPSAGIQARPPAYTWNGEKVNAGWVTTFNSHAVISENRLTVISEDFDLKVATLFGCAVTTAMGVVNNDAQLKVGESIVVFGVGGVGLNIVQAARMVSAYPIIGIDLVDEKLKLAETFGMTRGFNANTAEDIERCIREIVGEKGADVVVDTTGNARVIEQAYELTHPDGRTILVGVPQKGDNISIYSLPLHFKKVLTGSHGGSAIPDLDIPRYHRLIKAGMMNMDGIITHELNLEEVNEAINIVRSGEAGRVILNME